jgi:uncharacterized protein (TIGR03435 family)
MPDASDMELVREFAEHNSQSAFAELVRRHINLSYSVALRFTGNPPDAEDVTQAVFLILAKKAATLRMQTVLTGWIYETTRFVAMQWIRSRTRRQQHEQEAHMQSILEKANTGADWQQLEPLLETAMSRLSEKDRALLALRYFENRSAAETAKILGIKEWAAHKRAARALEKLRKYFSQRGVNSTTALIAAAISSNSIQLAPAALATSITAAAMTKGATASVSTATIIKGAIKIMAWNKAKTAIITGTVLLLAAGTTTTVAIRESNARELEKRWRINKDVPSDQIDKLPPMVKVLPTKFAPVWVNWNSGTKGDKFVGANASTDIIAAYAYSFPNGRIRFADQRPTNRFDFVATLPKGSREALQQELKKKVGLVGHPVMTNMDVLLLQVRRPHAPGFKPAIPGKEDTYSKYGAYHSSNVTIETGPPRFEGFALYLERYFKMPVIDQTGIKDYFSIDLRWREQPEQQNPDGLKQCLMDRLGLELVPTNMPVEILVMEKSN